MNKGAHFFPVGLGGGLRLGSLGGMYPHFSKQATSISSVPSLIACIAASLTKSVISPIELIAGVISVFAKAGCTSLEVLRSGSSLSRLLR